MATTRTLDQFKSNMANTGYSDSQLEGAYDLLKSGTSVNDVVNLLNKGKTTTTTTQTQTPTTTPTKTTTNVGYTTGTTPTSGTTTTTQPKTYTTVSGQQATKSDIATSTANAWNNMSYEQQQAALQKNPQIQTYLQQAGLTTKRQTEGATQYNVAERPESPKPQQPSEGWAYQSDEEWRIQQTVGNLDWYKRNMNNLFDSWETYYDFFLKDTPRSPAQQKAVEQYYRDYQKYKPYDNMTGSQIGAGLADGTIPSDYLDYLKNNDPVKYGEAMEGMKAEQDRIGNQAFYDSMIESAGLGIIEGAGKKGDLKERYEYTGIFIDNNRDGIDDGLYVPPTDEEKSNQERRSQLIAEKQRIQDEIEAAYDELVKQYPGASSSTLRAMANDQTANLSKELKELTYQITQLEGNIGYMQDERKTQMDARYKSIGVLQQDLGFYYQYSSQGLSDLAQAKYGATNVSFEQADNGTYTQKQMALEAVLSPLYEQFGDIIQRPQAQVINDIINYAQEKGIGLEQAFNENFMTPLKSKPQYSYMVNKAAYGNNGLDFTRVGTDENGNPIYGFVDTINGTVSPYGDYIKNGGEFDFDTTTRKGKADAMSSILDYNEGDLGWSVSDIYDVFAGQNYGECGEFVNDYYKAVTGSKNGLITGTWADRKALANQSHIPTAGSIVFFDWTNSPTATDKQKTYGHVGLVESVDSTGIWVVDANWDGKGTVDRRHIDYSSDLYKQRVAGFYNIPESAQKRGVGGMSTVATYNDSAYAKQLYDEYNALGSKGLDTTAKQNRVKAMVEGLGLKNEAELVNQAEAYWRQKDADAAMQQLQVIDQMIASINDLPDMEARQRFGTDQVYGNLKDKTTGNLGTIGLGLWESMSATDKAKYTRWSSSYDKLMANLMYDKYQDVKSTGGTFGSMSNAEWDSLKQAASDLSIGLDKDTYLQRLKELRQHFQKVADKGGTQSMGGQSVGGMSTNYNIKSNGTYGGGNVLNGLMSSFNFTSY